MPAWLLPALIGGSTVVGGLLGRSAAGDAADAAQAGTLAGIAEQQRQFDTLARLFAPQIAQGTAARNEIAALLGIPTGDTMGLLRGLNLGAGGGAGGLGLPVSIEDLRRGGSLLPILSNIQDAQITQAAAAGGQTPEQVAAARADALGRFEGSPGLQFALDQSRRQVEASQAARGAADSGGTLAAISDRAMGIGLMDFGNHINRLLALATGGQAATQSLGAGSMATGGAISNLLSQGGQIQGAGILGGANSIANSLNNLGSNLALWQLFGGGNTAPQPAPVPSPAPPMLPFFGAP